MNAKERIIAALTWGELDYIPWTAKPNHFPRGEYERRLRNSGMGLTVECSIYDESTLNLTVESISEKDYLIRVYHTPLGKICEKIRTGLPSEAGERSDTWRVEHLIKSDEDYEIVEYLFENRRIKPKYKDFEIIENSIEGDGVVLAWIDYTPFMDLLINYMGIRKLVIEIHRNKERLEGLLEVIAEKKREICKVVAESPAKLVLLGDNIDEVLVNPRLFKKYCLPYYQEYTGILHKRGKLVGSHMDGRLKNLKDLIKESGLDFIHGFTPPPIGNLTIKEARESWGKYIALWVNVPGTTFYYEPERLESYIRSLLIEAAPGDGFMLGITETVPPLRRNMAYEVIMNTVLKYGKYPITA